MNEKQKKIFVTRPFLPARKEYEKILDRVWDSSYLTNFGPILTELEKEIKTYTGVENLTVSNGTFALNLAYELLKLKGKKVLTTPFSFIATASTLAWDRIDFDFVDIDEQTYNIDPVKLEIRLQEDASISAIVATHVFGNPCDVKRIAEIAKKYDVKIIYDAAHSFGVKIDGVSIFKYGDLSTCSYHATKIFHTVEGGAVFSNSPEVILKLKQLSNFGYNPKAVITEVGINTKVSEFHASMGLANIKHISNLIDERLDIIGTYKRELSELGTFQKIDESVSWNGAYMPILLPSSAHVEKLFVTLEENFIYPRRYFYPSLDELGIFSDKSACPVSRNIASRIVCLPLFNNMNKDDLKNIIELIKVSQ